MDTSKLLEYGNRCYNAKYTTVENNGDYAIERDGNTLYLMFEWSDGAEDWLSNFNFPSTPYKDMEVEWKCHRGFLKVWKSIKPYIEESIMDMSVEKIIIIGYSHGAAIAALAHEYVWFNRPDLRDDNLEGYGFGAPRCYCGFKIRDELKERWKNFYVIRNCHDIVTHVPPVIFGFRHVGNMVAIGNGTYEVRKRKLKCIDAHRFENYQFSLKNCCVPRQHIVV